MEENIQNTILIDDDKKIKSENEENEDIFQTIFEEIKNNFKSVDEIDLNNNETKEEKEIKEEKKTKDINEEKDNKNKNEVKKEENKKEEQIENTKKRKYVGSFEVIEEDDFKDLEKSSKKKVEEKEEHDSDKDDW